MLSGVGLIWPTGAEMDTVYLSLSLSMDTRGWERGKEAEMGKGWEEEKRVMEIMAWAVA